MPGILLFMSSIFSDISIFFNYNLKKSVKQGNNAGLVRPGADGITSLQE